MDTFSIDVGATGGSMSLNDDESRIMDEISIEMPARKTVPLRAKPPVHRPFAKRTAGPSFQGVAEDDGLDMFTNPGKRAAQAPPPPEEFDGGEEEMEEGEEK
jgi:hypothetical protein